MHAISKLLPAAGDESDAREILEQLEKNNKKSTKTKVLVSLDLNGKQLAINDNLLGIFIAMLEKVSRGESVSVISNSKEFSTREAAELLHLSRPYLANLLDKGAIPFHRVGSHRRIAAKDLFAYQAKLEQQKQDAFEELARLGQEIEHGVSSHLKAQISHHHTADQFLDKKNPAPLMREHC